MLRRRAFRYETLLKVRKLREEQQAQKLAAVRRDIFRAQQELRSIQEEQLHILEEAGRAAAEQFNARDVQQFYNYERFLARRAVECDARIATLRRQEKERLAELETANRHKRVVERLKERHAALFRTELNALEQKLADETALRQLKKDAPRGNDSSEMGA